MKPEDGSKRISLFEIQAVANTLAANRNSHDKAYNRFLSFLAEAWLLKSTGNADSVPAALRSLAAELGLDSPTASRYRQAALAFCQKGDRLGAIYPRLHKASQTGNLADVQSAIRDVLSKVGAGKVYRALKWCSLNDCGPLPPPNRNSR